MNAYLCKKNGCAVVVLDGEIIRPCQNCTAPVVASVSVTLHALGSLEGGNHADTPSSRNQQPD
jgi:hypothetical protein